MAGDSERDVAREYADAPVDEIAAKGRYWNSPTVNARLGATFPPEDLGAAGLLLSALVGEVPDADEEASELATCRLMLAAIKVSGGSLLKLGMWVDAARLDPRDLIAAAEYTSQLTDDSPEACAADMREYLEWVAGGVRGDAYA